VTDKSVELMTVCLCADVGHPSITVDPPLGRSRHPFILS